jgi:hypothetical protein
MNHTSDNIVVLTGGSNPQSQRAANNTFIIVIRSESVGLDASQLRKSNYSNMKALHVILFQFISFLSNYFIRTFESSENFTSTSKVV